MNDNQNKRKPEVSTPGKISWKPGNMRYPLPVVREVYKRQMRGGTLILAGMGEGERLPVMD